MTYRRWIVVGVAFAVIGALVASFAVFYGSFSPRGFVEDKYTRAASLDIGSAAKAYTSPKKPSVVSKEITDAWKPADQYVDASGVYLRYDDDAVVIQPNNTGSVILVEKSSSAYPRYHGDRRQQLGLGPGQHRTGRRPRQRQVAQPLLPHPCLEPATC